MQQRSSTLELALATKPEIQPAKCGARQHTASVITYQDFSASTEAVWEALMFYEEVEKSLPLVLRVLLPKPIGSEGCKSEVGSEIKCRYVNGHILKRVTRIVHGRSYSFEVIEQSLALRGGIKVLGGNYTLRNLSEDRTRVALATRYQSPNQPRWLYGGMETIVCHSFHRHILAAMETNLRPR
jgi:hypothetical protein